MSATEQMRAMLDQLMGTARDGAEGKRHHHHFTDSRVCKSFLLSCCPHDILASTRMDLGECPKVHDLALRADYEAASASKDFGYELDAFEHLSSFVAEADRKTELAKKRLAETQEELSTEVTSKLNKVHELAETIGKKLADAEVAGADGNVEESLKLMEEVERTKKEKVAAEIEYRNSMPASSYQQQKLRVCEVCSAYLGIHDNDRRLADHFGGKLHLGFITIRERLEDLRVLVNEKKSKGLLPDRHEEGERDGRRRFDNRGGERFDRGNRGFNRYDRNQNQNQGNDNNNREKEERTNQRPRDRTNQREQRVAGSRSRSRSRERGGGGGGGGDRERGGYNSRRKQRSRSRSRSPKSHHSGRNRSRSRSPRPERRRDERSGDREESRLFSER